jgi:hypothetical protein
MGTRRTLVAWATILVVAWTALWPLVSAAHARLAGEAVVLCHQAGTMVAPDEMPAKPGTQDGKTHCPLCIMAFYGAPAPAFEAPAPRPSSLAERIGPRERRPHGDHQLALPPSRAPPASLPA